MHRKETPEFFVGDTVQVVSEPYRRCPFSWVNSMDEYCGKFVKITKKSYADAWGCYGYEIDADNGFCTWCKDCFMPVADETPDFDITDEEFGKLLLAEGV